jgi:hypothetical protein
VSDLRCCLRASLLEHGFHAAQRAFTDRAERGGAAPARRRHGAETAGEQEHAHRIGRIRSK